MRPNLVLLIALSGIVVAPIGCASGGAAAADTPKEGDIVVDPVCGSEVAVFEGDARVTHDGATYHFCSVTCAETFQADPGAYPAR